jgi:hypothetical protein
MRAQPPLARPVGTLDPDGPRADLRQEVEERRLIRMGGEPEPFGGHAGRRPHAFVLWPHQPTVVRPRHTQ